MPASSEKKGSVFVLLLLGIVLIFSLGGYIWLRNYSNKNTTLILTNKTSPLPTPSPWKAYTNTQYGFQLTYPKEGMILSKDGYVKGECGQAIGEEKNQEGETIKFDNFFEIRIVKWSRTIGDYLSFKGAKNIYDLKLTASSSAYQGIKLLGLKKGVEYAVGFPPLVYVNYIYQKGNHLYIFKDLEHPENLGGCINQIFLDPVKHAHFKNLKWDLDQSLKFF